MELLLSLAAKSLLVAGATLVLLKLARRRSASERSLIAHLGLLCLVILPVAALLLPPLEVEAPALLAPVAETTVIAATQSAPEVAANAGTFQQTAAPSLFAGIDWAFWAYAVPAALFFLLTLIALGRLVVLKAKANVLVEPSWLSALAHAQRRMGFKHGTALLTSDDLRSPISWGLMRPVILLNSDAAEAHSEAEAIIAHELAHVANLDWLKLLLSRIAIAIFWFNPLVWLLAREAHQLREEAADDAVLASNIEDHDYAKLLVGIARHECRGLLIGAHGVAPSRGSLARRIARVLDTDSIRGPVARSFAIGVFVGAMCLAAPLAAISFSSDANAERPDVDTSRPYYASADEAASSASPAAPVSTAIAAATGAATEAVSGAAQAVAGARAVAVQPSIEKVIEMKAVGVTPEYVASMAAAAPQLRGLSSDDLIDLAAVGVSPAFVREMQAAGYAHASADDLVAARAVGVTPAFAREIAAAGYPRLPIAKLIELRAIGVRGSDIQTYRRLGYGRPSVQQLVKLKALGVNRGDHDPDPDPDPDVDPDPDPDPDVEP